MKQMTKEEVERFLMTGTRTGKVATVRRDGSAHVVPVWFTIDNDEHGMNIVFETHKQSAKGRHL